MNIYAFSFDADCTGTGCGEKQRKKSETIIIIIILRLRVPMMNTVNYQGPIRSDRVETKSSVAFLLRHKQTNNINIEGVVIFAHTATDPFLYFPFSLFYSFFFFFHTAVYPIVAYKFTFRTLTPLLAELVRNW